MLIVIQLKNYLPSHLFSKTLNTKQDNNLVQGDYK